MPLVAARRTSALGSALALALALAITVAPAAAPARGLEVADRTWLAPGAAELAGLRLADDGAVMVDVAALRHPALADGRPSGLALWEPVPVPAGSGAARADLAGARGTVEVEVRSSPDGARWSAWTLLLAGEPVALAGERFLQARALVADGDASGRLDGLAVRFDQGGGADRRAAAAPAGNPTARLWATRIGLVGNRTANGHLVAERDRFVALPSRRALARTGGAEYQVRLAYKGRQVTAPVWDVGPWNTRDNYWDPPAEREQFKDLPRFLPQALAAWRDGYNGGRDQFGRWITFPASIDLADGTFLDDLGMRESDWVDVTFLWVDAPSPEPLASYPRVTRRAPPAEPPAQQKASAPPEPPPGQRWYFAEGSTRAPFQTWLLLQNPAPVPATATLTFSLADGTTRAQRVELRPTSRQSVFANLLLPDAEFSTQVDADRPVFVERAMYFGSDGHATTGVWRPETRGCTADGDTRDGTDTWLLVHNPGGDPAQARFTFYRDGGGTTTRALDVPPHSRRSLHVNAVVPGASFGACVEADRPLVFERASYRSGGGAATPAAPFPARAWYFAEGNARPGLSTSLALLNPGGEATPVEVTYLLEDGPSRKRTVTVPAGSKLRLDAAADVAGARFGMVVRGERPIVAERTVTFGPSATSSHSSGGSLELARTWYLPEGSTAPPFQEFVLVANPGPAAAAVAVDFMREDGSTLTRSYTVNGGARLTVDANGVVPDAALSVRVRSDQPVVVERSLYWGDLAGGTNTIGISWDR